jgi:hypothetical protein
VDGSLEGGRALPPIRNAVTPMPIAPPAAPMVTVPAPPAASSD